MKGAPQLEKSTNECLSAGTLLMAEYMGGVPGGKDDTVAWGEGTKVLWRSD